MNAIDTSLKSPSRSWPEGSGKFSLEVIDNFPGFENVTPYMEAEVARRGAKTVADIGGGANPVLS